MKITVALEQAFQSEHSRLYRWMLSRTGHHQSAEDLVQETYRIGWQKRYRITDASGLDKWLNAIAYNVYKRWRHQNSREQTHQIDFTQASQDIPVDNELEQNDELNLLEDALTMLSPENRRILIARYLEEQSQAKVAHDLGITENALAVRLHRSKMAVRTYIEQAVSDNSYTNGWQTTRLWCGICGQAHYEAKFDSTAGKLALHCPNCDLSRAYPAWDSGDDSQGLHDLKTIKPALNRLRKSTYERHMRVVEQGYRECIQCGAGIELHLRMPDFLPGDVQIYGMHIRCPHCGVVGYNALNGVAISLPVAFAFSKANPRFKTLPMRTLHHKGMETLHVPMRSIRTSDSLDVLFAKDTYRILSVYHNGQEVI